VVDSAKILVVDDDTTNLKCLDHMISKLGMECLTTDNSAKAIDLLSKEHPDIVFTDLKMPEKDGIAVLREVKKFDPNIIVILFTGYGSVDSAIKAMKAGALDYIQKPYLPEQIEAAIKKALQQKRLSHESFIPNRQTRNSVGFDNIIGKSKAIRDIFKKIVKISDSDANVLIYGESGTGKELLARSIHAHSRRSSNTFIPVDCVALPENLLESELFGHEKGAFTGAVSMRRGLLELADGGTLLLDEICELAPYLQAKLLRVLQEREFRRVGGKHLIKSDLRIISSTNKVPAQAVKNNILREDLYYRLNVIPMELPPLRDRKGDVQLLLNYFLQKFSKSSKGQIKSVDSDAISTLVNYPWPGNIRELRNVIERLISLSDAEKICFSDLPEYISSSPNQKKIDHAQKSNMPYYEAKSRFEEKYFVKLLEGCRWNISKAAKTAKINRKTMYRKIDTFKLNNKSFM